MTSGLLYMLTVKFLRRSNGYTINRFSELMNNILIGIVSGYLLYKKYSIADLPVCQSLKHLLCVALWMIAIFLFNITFFGTIEEYNGTHHFMQWENVTFVMFTGLAWSIGHLDCKLSV